jgi:hypothetical protein
VEVSVVFFVTYAVVLAGVLWYTLGFLPYFQMPRDWNFALNVLEYGLLSLLSFLAYRQEKHFRSIFFQFWLLFASVALTAPVVAHCMYWGGLPAGRDAYVRGLIVVHVMFAWVATKVLATYIFKDEKRWAINLLASVVVLPICAWLFWSMFWSPEILKILPSAVNHETYYTPVLTRAIVVNIISLLMLLAFFLHKLRTDRPIGVFADTILFILGLFYLVDTAEILSRVGSIELLSITQFANNILALAAIITLLLRLKYKSQTIAQYYESQCVSLNPDVGRRVGLFDRIILWGFFNPETVNKRIYLGAGRQKITVRRSSPRISRTRPSE